MIVVCDRCASQFELDDAKVPSGGMKVRCSRCQHAFVVASPAQPDADLAETWVRETLGADDADSSAAADVIESGDADESAGESDWGFNDDRPVEAAGLDAAREAVESLLGGVDPAPAPELDAEPATSGLSLDSDQETSSASFDDGPELEIGDESDIHDLSGEDPLDLGEDLDEFEEPSKWNFFDEESPTSYAEIPEPESAQTHVESAPESPSIGIGQPLVGLSGSGEASEKSGWFAKAGTLGGWTAVAIGIAACLLGGLGTPPPQIAPASVFQSNGFELDDIRARWVDNASTGPVYVISGRMRRSEGSSPWDAIPLNVELLDATGQPIEGMQVAIGPEIPSRYLHESSPVELKALQSNRARQFAAFAGTWLKFDAVVGNPPAAAERFAFVASQPGQVRR